MSAIDNRVSLRLVETGDLETLFIHQADPEAARMAAFPSRDREAFFAHWKANILGNPAAHNRTILLDGTVAGNIGAWTDAKTRERLFCYWVGREFWGRGIASAAVRQFLKLESARPLVAQVASHNLGSIRVLEKAGFTRVGAEGFTLPDGTRLEEFTYRLTA